MGKGIGFLITIIILQLAIAGMGVISLFPFASIILLVPIVILALLTIIFSIILFIK